MEAWYIRYGRRISRDPRLRKWDENWNMSEFRELTTLVKVQATLTWALMGLPCSMPWKLLLKFFFNQEKSELYVELIVSTSSLNKTKLKNI